MSFRRFPVLYFFITCIIFQGTVFSLESASYEKVDSLVRSGNSCLQKSDYQCAKNAYVNAYQMGMSRDSLAFMIAALYIEKGNFDTALVYNISCTTSTSGVFPEILDQRKKIMDVCFLKPPHDTLSGKIKKEEIRQSSETDYFELSFNNSYLNFKTGEYPLVNEAGKYHDAFNMNIANSSLLLSYDNQLKSRSGLYDPHFILSYGIIGLIDDNVSMLYSTRYLMFSSEFIVMNKKNRHSFTNSLSLQYGIKNPVISEYMSFDVPVIRGNWYYMPRISGRVNYEKSIKIQNARIAPSIYMVSLLKSRFRNAFGLLTSYNWKRDDHYYRFIQANTDSTVDSTARTLYLDPECVSKFNGFPNLKSYWNALPRKPVIDMPGQSVDITPVYNSVIKIGNNIQLESTLSLTGQYFFGEAAMYTIGSSKMSFFELVESDNNKDDVVVVFFYNKQNDRLYFIEGVEGNSWVLSENNRIYFHKKKRLEATLFLQSGLRFDFLRSGEFSINGWYSKIFSTIDQSLIALPLSDYNWGINTEWKLEVGFKKHAKQM